MITWAVNGFGQKTVYCHDCREVFVEDLECHVDVLEAVAKAKENHQCKDEKTHPSQTA